MKISRIEKPKIEIEIFDCSGDRAKVWRLFEREHYLTKKLNNSSRCFLACWNGKPVAFCAVLALPSGTVKNAWREHRLVVLPDYQGLGIGNRLSEWVGDLLISEGRRYFSKTANIKLGRYRDNSPKWRKTSKHGKKLYKKDIIKDAKGLFNEYLYLKRVCFAHEYVP